MDLLEGVFRMTRRRASMKALIPIGDLLSKSMFGRRGESLVELYRLRRAWGEIVGETLALRTWPKKINKGTLVIATANPVWTAQLSMMTEEIVKSLFEKTGRRFTEIRFVTEALPVQRSGVRS
jgi:predicted nucleic acid-binding Zn ribbon protein